MSDPSSGVATGSAGAPLDLFQVATSAVFETGTTLGLGPLVAGRPCRGWWRPSSTFTDAAITRAAAQRLDDAPAFSLIGTAPTWPFPAASAGATAADGTHASASTTAITPADADASNEVLTATAAHMPEPDGTSVQAAETQDLEPSAFLAACFPTAPPATIAAFLQENAGNVQDALNMLLAWEMQDTDPGPHVDAAGSVGDAAAYVADEVAAAVLAAALEDSVSAGTDADAVALDAAHALRMDQRESLCDIFPDIDPTWLGTVLDVSGSLDRTVAEIDDLQLCIPDAVPRIRGAGPQGVMVTPARPAAARPPTSRGRPQAAATSSRRPSKYTPAPAAEPATRLPPLPAWTARTDMPRASDPVAADAYTLADQLKRRELQRLYPDTPAQLLDDAYAQTRSSPPPLRGGGGDRDGHGAPITHSVRFCARSARRALGAAWK